MRPICNHLAILGDFPDVHGNPDLGEGGQKVKYRVVFVVVVDAQDAAEAETKAREAVEGFPQTGEEVSVAIKPDGPIDPAVFRAKKISVTKI
jgi:hypothetical protein